MSTLPTGTVTFLFTDIEGSTQLWEQFPIAMKSALARHDAILQRAVNLGGGQIIKTTGDGIHAVFDTVHQAATAVIAAQHALHVETWEELAPQSLRVRMALHSGEAELRDGDYYGSVLNRASRVMSAAYGGQILITQATAELLRDQLPSEAALLSLGEHRLKDLSRPEVIFELTHPSLPGDFPPLKNLDSVPNNLPIQLTSFIGREQEIAEIQNLLGSARLVTLTGSGGTGKTRLAQEVSARELSAFPHGVWLIELAPLADPDQIIPALAQVFGLQERPAASLAEMVTEYLRHKIVLLILDNCEHLIQACAHLADELLHHCAGLKILASSREALGIAGETAYRIPSLAEKEAVQLFVERARAVHSGFKPTQVNAAAIVQVCRRLDGIPLAIELAAARARLLSPEQIAARLDDRFRLLIGGSRTALPRQQTLRAMIDWSYDLLSDQEKHLLRRASVFTGGWTLDALEAVAQTPETLELLEQLVNKSLVAAEERGSQMRYYLLETIRQYAREKLLDSGAHESRQARDLHLEFFVKLAKASVPRLTGAEMIECLDELELEQDNLRAAIEWAIDTDPVSALRMAELLPTFWGRRLSASEGYAWIKRALARAEEQDQPAGNAAIPYLKARALALVGQAAMAFQLGNNPSAREAIDAGIALARQIHAVDTLAYALALGATICGFTGDIQSARDWSKEAMHLARHNEFAWTLSNLTGFEMFISVLSNQKIPPGLAEETLQAALACENPWALGMAYTNIGRVQMVEENWSEAYSHLEKAATLFRDIRDKPMYNASRSECGHLLRRQGRFPEAAAVYRETIVNFQESSQSAAVAHELECFAFIAVGLNHHQHAAELFGAAEALRSRIHVDMTMFERREYGEILAHLRERIPPADLEKAWAYGRSLSIEQAVQLALADPSNQSIQET